MQLVEELLESLFFEKTYYVKGRASVADVFRSGKRCGIYILHFENQECYVGQAIDVTRRYVQHRKNHLDIEKISFKRVRKSKLNEAEKEAIFAFEGAGIFLRNIVFTSIPKGESDFDFVLPIKDQDEWLKDLGLIHMEGERFNDPTLRRKYEARLSQFLGLPFAEDAIEVLRQYIQKGIPAIKAGEQSFWSVSCLPSYKNPNAKIYSRININWQEVFAIFEIEDQLYTTFQLAISPLDERYGDDVDELLEKHPDVLLIDHTYDPGGIDQLRLEAKGKDATLKLLEDPSVLRAIRLFNLRLMKKGPNTYGRYHSFPLADHLID